MPLTHKQHEVLRKPLNRTRIANRQQGGKTLSYLESWEVRAHLIRVFGYTNFDVEVLDYNYVGSREYQSQNSKDMVEVIYTARVRLVIRDEDRNVLCHYTECAAGSTSGPANMLGEHHDNAIKTAVSDAMKRCAINLGTQFGLSLYDDGSTRDVVKQSLIGPDFTTEAASEEQVEMLRRSLGAKEVGTTETAGEGVKEDGAAQ